MAAASVLRLLLAIFVLLLISPAHIDACSCRQDPLCESYWEHSVVFAGEVVDVTTLAVGKGVPPQFRDRQVRFKVERAWRGQVPEVATVMTGGGGGDCGYTFRPAQRYLVYAYERRERLWTNICSPTKPFEAAAADLEYLNSATGSPVAGLVYGTVRLPTVRPAGGYVVVLQTDRHEWKTTTDADGDFELRGIPAGSYKLRVIVPDSERARGPEDVNLPDPRACARRDFWIERFR